MTGSLILLGGSGVWLMVGWRTSACIGAVIWRNVERVSVVVVTAPCAPAATWLPLTASYLAPGCGFSRRRSKERLCVPEPQSLTDPSAPMASDTRPQPQARKPCLLSKIEAFQDVVSAAVIIPKEDGVISVSDDKYACTLCFPACSVRCWLGSWTVRFLVVLLS